MNCGPTGGAVRCISSNAPDAKTAMPAAMPDAHCAMRRYGFRTRPWARRVATIRSSSSIGGASPKADCSAVRSTSLSSISSVMSRPSCGSQVPADRSARMEELALRGSRRDSEQLRDLGVAEPLDIVEQQDLAASLRQRRNRADQIDALVRRRRHRLRRERDAFAMAPPLAATIDDDAEQPRPEGRLPAEVHEPAGGAYPAVVHRLLRLGDIAAPPHREPIQRRRMSAVELAERR